nr:hypothetical protein Iba_chr10eCG1040 [Ipomoea batatas]
MSKEVSKLPSESSIAAAKNRGDFHSSDSPARDNRSSCRHATPEKQGKPETRGSSTIAAALLAGTEDGVALLLLHGERQSKLFMCAVSCPALFPGKIRRREERGGFGRLEESSEWKSLGLWGSQKWNQVNFEAFELEAGDGDIKARRPEEEHSGKTMMYWGCWDSDGKDWYRTNCVGEEGDWLSDFVEEVIHNPDALLCYEWSSGDVWVRRILSLHLRKWESCFADGIDWEYLVAEISNPRSSMESPSSYQQMNGNGGLAEGLS